LNSEQPIAGATRIVKAKQTVLHQKGYPSALILPIIPAKANDSKGDANVKENRRAISETRTTGSKRAMRFNSRRASTNG
jgi:hypothetical protein